MTMQKNISLAPYTSFGVGGIAENFYEAQNTDQLIEVLETNSILPIHLLGYGSNTLIADGVIPGLVLCLKGGTVNFSDTEITVDAGVWWDDVVQQSIDRKLWGIELMSEIPGSVGAALFINITAYGQTIGPLVKWIDVWDPKIQKVRRIDKKELIWGYKESIFQKANNKDLVILRAALSLSRSATDEIVYQKALDVAEELGLSTETLSNRRQIIIEARKRAGSIWHPNQSLAKTAGSFFRNPVVDEKLADEIMSYDETGKTTEQIKTMNLVHGGDKKRVSAAHVLLACGFARGQQWGNVKLNDQNLLKIEALPNATAKEIYEVSTMIQKTCFEKLGINLEPEAQLLGNFN